jgi:DNA-binding transcriptional ArsR family regulator
VTTVAEERQPSPFELAARDLPRELRAEQGSEQITAWCPTCQERAVPMRNGTCAFCETVIVSPAVNGNGHPSVVEPRVGGEPEAGVLRLGGDLLLPLDAATESLAILAVKGAGKSNAAAVLAEELFDEGIPWVVIDPKGDWWGIRETVGDSRGLPVLVFGGMHGDLPLSPCSGGDVAELIVERNLTCVLDVSAMDDEDRPEFLHGLGLQLFELHRRAPSVRHIILEEAHEVVPQGGGKEMRPTLKAWTRIVCQGRQRGLGITLVSQRSALVHKNVLTQTGSLIVLRTTSPQDRAVIRSWVDFHSVGKELVDSLPELSDGEAWIIAPSWLGRVARVRLRRRWTFDSGATPEVVPTRRTQTLDTVDIEEIGRALSREEPAERPEATPDVDESADAERIILDLVAEAPRKRGELARATGLSEGRLARLLRDLAEGGVVRMEGQRGGATWAAADWQEPETPEPVTLESSSPGVGLARRLVAARRDAEDALEQLDGMLAEPQESLTLLRARYLAALLARIEAGDVDDALLDRFERAAGFA